MNTNHFAELIELNDAELDLVSGGLSSLALAAGATPVVGTNATGALAFGGTPAAAIAATAGLVAAISPLVITAG